MADAQCRVAEGYTCDDDWHACLIPNTAAIVPRECPDRGGRDATTSAVGTLSPGREPAAVLANSGRLVTITAFGGEISGTYFTAAGSQPALARDARGTLYAVWCSGVEVMLATSSDSGNTWSERAAAGDPADAACERPTVVAGKDVLYVLYGASGLRVRASRDGGKTWTRAVTPLAGRRGAAVVGGDGRLHVIALDGSDRGGFGAADQRVEYAVSSDGGATFTRPRLVSAPEEALPYYFAIPRLALDDKTGWLYAVYVSGGRSAVWEIVIAGLKLKDKTATWKRVRLGDGCSLRMTPAAALDPTTGALHVAWHDNRGRARFAHAVCAVGLATCTETGRISEAAFGAPALDPDRGGEQAVLLVDDGGRVMHALWVEALEIVHATAKLPPR
jgi:hypothetical protein